jgi:hypothetical protein
MMMLEGRPVKCRVILTGAGLCRIWFSDAS